MIPCAPPRAFRLKDARKTAQMDALPELRLDQLSPGVRPRSVRIDRYQVMERWRELARYTLPTGSPMGPSSSSMGGLPSPKDCINIIMAPHYLRSNAPCWHALLKHAFEGIGLNRFGQLKFDRDAC